MENIKNTVLFPEVKDGDTFQIGPFEFIKFPANGDKTPVVMRGFAFIATFGRSNDLRSSPILSKMEQTVLPKIVECVGADNVCEFETDLTTLDGLKPYGKMTSRISLPTFDFYRANVEIFDKYKLDDWWWLATPDTAQPHYDPVWVSCVSPRGGIYRSLFNRDFGVRPFLILKSAIFESSEA